MSLWISIEMLYTACIEGAGSSDDATNLLTNKQTNIIITIH